MINIEVKNGPNVRVLIAKKGFSLRTFSNKIGISHAYLSQILNSLRNPSPEMAKRISEGVGLNIDDIFFISYGNMQPKKDGAEEA